LQPTDIQDPEYFHKVVDCQYACPAHTPVPEYIRLIAEGRYTEAYMINWDSNVFPGILGRTCDRPCEPACRRGRVEEEPVAICRLKRVAADNKDEVKHLMPQAPFKPNGKKVALIGAGPASLTVARDLAPLGYEIHLFDEQYKGGGFMLSQIPAFRLPERVLDEEVNYILDLGIHTHFKHYVDSLKGVLGQDYDAVFVGTGAPRGRDLPDLPGRQEGAANIFIGINWLGSVAFEHTAKIGKRVIVLGGGNTAMDCCRTARRLGGEDVKVIVRSPFATMKASPWEKEDAQHEDIPIIDNHVPKSFVIENGKLVGMTFEKVEAVYDENGKRSLVPTGEPEAFYPADDVLIAVGQENAFPWIERDIGVEFDKWEMPVVDKVTFQSTHPKVFFGGDAAFGPENVITAVAHGHQAAVSIDLLCKGERLTNRLHPMVNLVSQKMGIHEWAEDDHAKEPQTGSRNGLRPSGRLQGSPALPQLRRANGLLRPEMHRMRRLRRHLPNKLHHLHRKRRRGRSPQPHKGSGPELDPGPLRLRSPPANRPHHGQRRRRLPPLRPLRRTLPHRRVGYASLLVQRHQSRRGQIRSNSRGQSGADSEEWKWCGLVLS
jgi:formate dehydrogenase beta subunit